MVEELYREPDRLDQFMRAMAGIQAGNFHALAEKVDFGSYRTRCRPEERSSRSRT